MFFATYNFFISQFCFQIVLRLQFHRSDVVLDSICDSLSLDNGIRTQHSQHLHDTLGSTYCQGINHELNHVFNFLINVDEI